MKPRLDHIGLDVSDYARSKAFYEKALVPLGMKLVMEPVPNACGFGDEFPFFWISRATSGPTAARMSHSRRRIARPSTTSTPPRSTAGGKDNGGPGVREIYHPNYYGAFVLDPDGNNIEAVCHTPA